MKKDVNGGKQKWENYDIQVNSSPYTGPGRGTTDATVQSRGRGVKVADVRTEKHEGPNPRHQNVRIINVERPSRMSIRGCCKCIKVSLYQQAP